MKPHRFHPEANEEYAHAATHYAGISLELGGRFYEEIERLIAEVLTAPLRFRRIDCDVRRHLADDFPYALLYLDEPDCIWIVAVMPLRRDPDYWKHRLEN
ncbi:MAG: type II toxin-antitoxin system RelE/ParE family toxin [Opitutaceae bacterium]